MNAIFGGDDVVVSLAAVVMALALLARAHLSPERGWYLSQPP